MYFYDYFIDPLIILRRLIVSSFLITFVQRNISSTPMVHSIIPTAYHNPTATMPLVQGTSNISSAPTTCAPSATAAIGTNAGELSVSDSLWTFSKHGSIHVHVYSAYPLVNDDL
jgi:hypothetical protein